ncbi:MAG: dienelactone hydrolase family protein [Pseudomonadales bacterium]|nr:dienelactone hydrolase family protein [Pseudomonadales bacterium]
MINPNGGATRRDMQSNALPTNQYALTLNSDATALIVLAHGSATHLATPHLTALSRALADEQVATLRFNFRYRMANRAFPGKLRESINDFYDAFQVGLDAGYGLPTFLAGHSYGGRVMTHLLVDDCLGDAPAARQAQLKGGIAYSLPLHPKTKPNLDRWQHLPGLRHPMLVIAGDRDPMISPRIASEFIAQNPRCTFQWIPGADHGLQLTKRATNPHQSVYEQVAQRTRAWISAIS